MRGDDKGSTSCTCLTVGSLFGTVSPPVRMFRKEDVKNTVLVIDQ